MTNYEVLRLSTVAQCDAALRKLPVIIENLEYKKLTLTHKICVHNRVAANAAEELKNLTAEFMRLNDLLSGSGESQLTQKYRYRLIKVQYRVQFLELRLKDYSPQALLAKELHLHQTVLELEETVVYRAQLEARRSELLHVGAPGHPARPVEPEAASLVEPVPVQESTAEQAPQPVTRLFHKQKGRRWTRAKQVMKRAV